MEVLPIELMGSKNFPDIEIEEIQLDKKQVRIVGEMQIDSIIDSTLIDGLSELIFAPQDSSEGVELWKELGQDWIEVETLSVQLIYLIESQENGSVILEGSDVSTAPIRIIIPQATILHRYL